MTRFFSALTFPHSSVTSVFVDPRHAVALDVAQLTEPCFYCFTLLGGHCLFAPPSSLPPSTHCHIPVIRVMCHNPMYILHCLE
jgi:hypothetical protein